MKNRLTIAAAERGHTVTNSLEEFSPDLELDELFASKREDKKDESTKRWSNSYVKNVVRDSSLKRFSRPI